MSDLRNVKFYGRGDQDIELDIDPFLDDIIRNIVGDTGGGLSVTMIVTPGDAEGSIGTLILFKGVTIGVLGTEAKALGLDPIITSPIVIGINLSLGGDQDYEGDAPVFGNDPIISEPGITLIVSGGQEAVYGNDPTIVEAIIMIVSGGTATANGNDPTITNEYIITLTGGDANAGVGTLTVTIGVILIVFGQILRATGNDPVITEG